MSLSDNKRPVSLILLLISLLVWVSILNADPATDCVVSGSLIINSQEAESGTRLEAYIDGEKIVSTTTTATGQYLITIPKYDPAEPQTRGYKSESDVVVIKVNQQDAEPNFNPLPGALKVNLEVKTTLDVKLTTWGKIKALFK
jgi:hypothetical protein